MWVQLHFGYDPDIEGFDQTPFHFNESGSKSKKTLEFTGKKKITLKEALHAIRDRWTATTWTTSNAAEAAEQVPLEVCFKGGSGVLSQLTEILDRLRARSKAREYLYLWRTVVGDSYKMDVSKNQRYHSTTCTIFRMASAPRTSASLGNEASGHCIASGGRLENWNKI